MSLREKLGTEQFSALVTAPAAATTYVSLASGGGLEMIAEIIGAGKFVQQLLEQSGGSGYGVLVVDLLAEMKDMPAGEAQTNTLQYQSKDPQSIREELKQAVINGAQAAESMPGADGYKRWIIDMARAAAATKTGGFLGIGAKSVVDEKEQAALDELAGLLGV